MPEVNQELVPLVERMRPMLVRILSAAGIPPHDADDILQEVFLAALNKWASILNKDAWLVGALRKRCYAYWRRRQTDLLEAVDTALLELISQPQPAPQERAALLWDLENAFGTLPPRHRAVLWLRFGLGLSSDEVADRLGYSPTSIRKLIGRSLERLRGAVAASPRAGAGPGGASSAGPARVPTTGIAAGPGVRLPVEAPRPPLRPSLDTAELAASSAVLAALAGDEPALRSKNY